MPTLSSFKAQFRQAPARAPTPPQPPYEPLSPSPAPGRAPLSAPTATMYRSSDLDAAAAERARAAHQRQYAHPAATMSAMPWPPPLLAVSAPPPAYTHAPHERLAKRARSELYASYPQSPSQSRPATSHLPGWAYNVEHMVDSATRRYQQDGRPPAEDRLSDAQLLLDFFAVAATTAQSPPATAKRWSVPHAHSLSQPDQPVFAPISSHIAAASASDPSITQPPPLAVPDTQTHTPPNECPRVVALPMIDEGEGEAVPAPESKLMKHQGWPKGKPRGPYTASTTGKRKRAAPKPKEVPSSATNISPGASSQLHSPASLPAGQLVAFSAHEVPHQPQEDVASTPFVDALAPARRHSVSYAASPLIAGDDVPPAYLRAQSLPLHGHETTAVPTSSSLLPSAKSVTAEQPDLICAACNSSTSETKVGDGEQWIGCDGCKGWHHYVCAGFSSEREVRDVNKFYCEPCRPKFGETTKVRKSVRAHTTVDYAGLNEGVLKTSDDHPEHHYIGAFKNGDMNFTPETFPRMPPELITGDFLEKTNGFKEPILIPSALNPRPEYAEREDSPHESGQRTAAAPTTPLAPFETESNLHFETEIVPDDGQDGLDMVIPRGLTVRRVAELYGANEPVPVIDVKAQEGEGKKWTMGKWADYYEQQGEKPVRNVISLEVSRSKLGKLIRRPKAVREMDLQDSVWPEDDKFAPPPVQFYCLMSVADCFTDFHIDFGGSSVYYHIIKGKKVFFFIPPTKQNLKKYEDWCLSPNQGHEWLGKQVKECFRVDLSPGDTMLIPSGWIHAVWTPEDSLVIGGNFLTRIHYGMQIKVLEIEKNTKVALQFRYPFFQKIMWLTAIQYLEEDPVPEPVQQLLQNGGMFERSTPIYCEPNRFGHNSHLGVANYNRRYYSKHELEGLTDLLNYIWRTVLIAEGSIEVPQKTRNAVNKSIPKGHGEPVALARRLAMWIAWKRGNETIPAWAFSDASLPEAVETEKKPSAAQVKKLERETLNEALRATAERSSARLRRASDVVIPDTSPPLEAEVYSQLDVTQSSLGPLTGFLRPSANHPHITTPKTSQLGPKRVACDACRKRRIRCKHKDELVDTSKPGMHTIDLSGSYGISVKRRLSDHSLTDSLVNSANGPLNGGPIMADANGDPYALKSGRVKACADCRKSKRRCIHDEYGNVDPIKANEVPIPRGSASKKRRVSEEDSLSIAKRIKYESSYDEDYMHDGMPPRHVVSNQYSGGSLSLQDIAFSAQQALDQSPDGQHLPVDPTLQAYANHYHENYATIEDSSFSANGNTVISSVEYQTNEDILIDGTEPTGYNRESQGAGRDLVTPSSPPHEEQPVRHPSSSSISRHLSGTSPSRVASPTKPFYHTTTTTVIPTTPTTPHHPPPPPHSATHFPSSGKKQTHTPSSTRRASKTPKSAPGAGRRHANTSKDVLKMGRGRSSTATTATTATPTITKNAEALFGASTIPLDDQDPYLDQASRDLIKQLQQEDLGLRRRRRSSR